MVLENDPPRTRELRADVPQALDDAVAGALTKNPDKRYRDVAEFAQDIAVAMNDGNLLEQAQRIRRIVSRGTDDMTGSQQVSSATGTLARSHIRTRPDEGRNRKLMLGAAALAALLLAGGLGAYFASTNAAPEATPEATAAPMEVPLPTVPTEEPTVAEVPPPTPPVVAAEVPPPVVAENPEATAAADDNEDSDGDSSERSSSSSRSSSRSSSSSRPAMVEQAVMAETPPPPPTMTTQNLLLDRN